MCSEMETRCRFHTSGTVNHIRIGNQRLVPVLADISMIRQDTMLLRILENLEHLV